MYLRALPISLSQWSGFESLEIVTEPMVRLRVIGVLVDTTQDEGI